MARHTVRHIAVKEGESFDLGLGEWIFSIDHDAPWFHIVLLWSEVPDNDGQEAT